MYAIIIAYIYFMSETSPSTYTTLAQQASQIGPLRATLLGVLWIIGFGSTRVDTNLILNQTPSEAIQAWLSTNWQVQGVLGQVDKPWEWAVNDIIPYKIAA